MLKEFLCGDVIEPTKLAIKNLQRQKGTDIIMDHHSRVLESIVAACVVQSTILLSDRDQELIHKYSGVIL